MELQWPLILFTTLVAWSAGVFGTQAVLALRGEAPKAQLSCWITAAVLLAAGGIAVFFHLEHFERIFNGFGHLTSGITQELIAIVVLAVALVCAIVKEPVRLAATVALIGAAVNAVTTIVYAVTLQFLEGSFTTVGYYSDPTMPTAPLVDVTAVGNVFTGELAPLMWIGVILVGAVVPLIAALLEKRSGATPAADGTAVASRAELWMAVAVIAAVIGAICMRVVFYELGASVFMLY